MESDPAHFFGHVDYKRVIVAIIIDLIINEFSNVQIGFDFVSSTRLASHVFAEEVHFDLMARLVATSCPANVNKNVLIKFELDSVVIEAIHLFSCQVLHRIMQIVGEDHVKELQISEGNV